MKEKASKFVNVLKKDGIYKTLRKTYKYIMANYINKINFIRRIQFKLNKEKIIRRIQYILKESEYERVIVWRGSFGWNVPLFQRPQHIARCLSNKKCLIFYEVTRMTDKTKFIDQYKDNLFLVNYEIKEFEDLLWDELIKVQKPKYLQIYSTCWDINEKKMQKYIESGYKLLYEYIDDLNPILAGTKQLPQNVKIIHEYVCDNIDNALVITSADNLYNDIIHKRKSKKNVILSSNGVEYEHFHNTNKDRNISNNKFNAIINAQKPIIGYYGALASWFDYELIKYLAKDNPDINFVLIGIKYDNSFDESQIDKIKNVHYIGTVDYKDLPQYATWFDVCIIPFVINDITKATNPIKVFEYMALEKPIVTTPMDECKKYKSVMIGNSKENFSKLINDAMNLNPKEDKEYYDTLKLEALNNTWESKANDIIELLKEEER